MGCSNLILFNIIGWVERETVIFIIQSSFHVLRPHSFLKPNKSEFYGTKLSLIKGSNLVRIFLETVQTYA